MEAGEKMRSFLIEYKKPGWFFMHGGRCVLNFERPPTPQELTKLEEHIQKELKCSQIVIVNISELTYGPLVESEKI